MKVAPKNAVAPVLKSNAYGHGLIEIAKILEYQRHSNDTKRSIPFFIVDSYFEAVTLRSAGIRTPLLIIGYTRPETIARARIKNVSFTVTSIETLRQIAHFQSSITAFLPRRRRIPIHLKIDTGMRRQGILPDELDYIDEILDINQSIILTGICSHFSDADNDDPSFTESQIHLWNKIVTDMQSKYISIKHIHISNTDGHRFVRDAIATFSRLGLGLYGLVEGSLFSPSLNIKPIMRIETIITDIKKLARDETVGYGNTFKADRDMVIATIPVGYYEGVDRRLSNTGKVLVSREHDACKIIGRVSMNITVIDVSHIPDVQVGTQVTVISDDSADPNSIVNMAKICNTIPYEIAVHIPGQLKRLTSQQSA